MTDNFYLSLAAILLLPLFPAFIIYKFLPASDTDVSGPYQGLSLKLKGAFAGYFLLVIVGVALQYVVMNNKQEKRIEELGRAVAKRDTAIAQLQAQLAAAANPVIDWHILGSVKPVKEGTRFFYDDGTTRNDPDGSFDLIKRSIAKEGEARPPKWVCVYNTATGFRVVSLNREINHPDIEDYAVRFNDQEHKIIIEKPIDINTIERDSIIAVANYIEKNPVLKERVQEVSPGLLEKADVLRKEKQLDKVRLLQFNRSALQGNQ